MNWHELGDWLAAGAALVALCLRIEHRITRVETKLEDCQCRCTVNSKKVEKAKTIMLPKQLAAR